MSIGIWQILLILLIVVLIFEITGRDLREGERVQYKLTPGKNGKSSAEDLKRAVGSEVAAALEEVAVTTVADAALERAPRELRRRRELRVLRGTDARLRDELLHGCGKQRVEPAEPREQLARDVEGTAPARAGAQEQREQLGVGQCLRTVREQAFARAFFGGKVGDAHGASMRRARAGARRKTPRRPVS